MAPTPAETCLGKFGNDGGRRFRDLQKHGLSLPAIASLLEEHSPSRKEFVEQVRDALYHGFPFYPDGVDESNGREFVDYFEKNVTLRTVAALCAVRNSDNAAYSANPRIHAVVTLNIDGLLQEYVEARYGERLFRTIERPSASRRPEKINLYHMHGYLQFGPSAGDQSRENNAVVLTEQDYFDFFNAPTGLFNYTFLYLLREFTCVFIGLSMRDENIRRLLHYSKQERFRALIQEQEGPSDAGKSEIRGRTLSDAKLSEIRGKTLRHYAVLNRSGSVEVDTATEETLRPLGTSVLWVGDFTEIPQLMERIYESAGNKNKWSDVFDSRSHVPTP